MNRLIPLEQFAKQMVDDLNRVCDELGIPEKERGKVAMAALAGLMYSPSPPQGLKHDR